MTLILKGISLDEEPMSLPLLGRFDERGGTLGRSDEATLTLPDPERLISRSQAQVLHQSGHYWLENMSAASAVLHNSRPLSEGMRVVLGEGDEIRIGGYALQVSFEDDEAAATILRGRTTATPALPAKGAPQPGGQRQSPLAAQSGFSTPKAPPTAERAEPGGTLSEPALQFRSGERTDTAADPVGVLWQSFLQGAQLSATAVPGGPSPTLLRSVGEMLRVAITGLQRLITLRARTKNDMQAEMTMIQAQGNNPLKFSPEPALAMQMLLQAPARGFLNGPAALSEALADLQAHQLGMTAGMRAVLEAVLDRLDPEKLQTSQEQSMLDSLQPARKRARLWDAYVSEHKSLSDEARDNFQRFFGEVFREAYEAQVQNPEGAESLEPDRTDMTITPKRR